MLEAAEVVNGAKKFFNRSMCCPGLSIAYTSERNTTARRRYLGIRAGESDDVVVMARG